MAKSFRVTATPRTRFNLSVLLFHKDLQFKDRLKERSLYRSRKNLGLLEPSQQFSTNNRVGDIWRDHTTRNVFTVTEDNADFMIETIGKLEKNTNDLLYIEELLEQLEAKEDAADADTASEFNEQEEAPRWKPGLEPIITNPALFYDVLREAVKHGNYGGFCKVINDALKIEPEDVANDVTPISQAKAG
jgi:hypothetical protein